MSVKSCENRGRNIEMAFWEKVEFHMAIDGGVPPYIKKVLEKNGYTTAATIKTLNDIDNDYFETFIRNNFDTIKTELVNDKCNDDAVTKYSGNGKDFKILRGHRKLVEQIVVFVNAKTQSGFEFFSFKKITNKNITRNAKPKSTTATEATEASNKISSSPIQLNNEQSILFIKLKEVMRKKCFKEFEVSSLFIVKSYSTYSSFLLNI